MSLDSATEFFSAMMQDDEMLDLAVQATEGKQGPERTQALVSIGAARGYEFTAEAATAVQEMIEHIAELSDEDLDAVAGGVNMSQLQQTISSVEADQEAVRNKRQMASSQFENANQQASQYVNMLSSVMKTMNEAQSGIIRNLR